MNSSGLPSNCNNFQVGFISFQCFSVHEVFLECDNFISIYLSVFQQITDLGKLTIPLFNTYNWVWESFSSSIINFRVFGSTCGVEVLIREMPTNFTSDFRKLKINQSREVWSPDNAFNRIGWKSHKSPQVVR